MANADPSNEALVARADCVRLSEAVSAVERAYAQLAGAGDALVRVQLQHVNPLAISDREEIYTAIFRVRVAQAAMHEVCDSLAELLVRLRQRWGVRP